MSDCVEAEQFFRGIPPEDTETICEIMCDAICQADGKSESGKVEVIISEMDNINISNIEASGFLTYNGIEHSFTAQAGDRNGFEIIAFDTEHTPYDPRYTVIPTSVYTCADSNANSFLKLWKAHEKSLRVRDIMMERSSCLYTNSPTTAPDSALAARGLEVVDGDTADRYKAKLVKQHAIHLLRK